MNDETSRLFGKYRGRVIGNIDPMGIGRLQVQVPDVSGLVSTDWAMPCVPMAGPQAGMVVVPPVGSNVWVEFEQGDPDYPIWVGGFWSSAADMPAVSSSDPAAFVIRTPGQGGLTISDAPGPFGGIVLKSADGASLIVNDTGIHIQNGKGASITLVGPTVSVNLGALAVT
jgi:uncharacterized protein involved in type VI secretion and phage assembly